jgi:hypothetical protein
MTDPWCQAMAAWMLSPPWNSQWAEHHPAPRQLPGPAENAFRQLVEPLDRASAGASLAEPGAHIVGEGDEAGPGDGQVNDGYARRKRPRMTRNRHQDQAFQDSSHDCHPARTLSMTAKPRTALAEVPAGQPPAMPASAGTTP